MFVTLDITGSTNCLHLADLQEENHTIVIKSSLELNGYVLGISVGLDTGCLVLQMTDGALYKYNQGTMTKFIPKCSSCIFSKKKNIDMP